MRLTGIDHRFGRIEGLLIQSPDLRERIASVEGRVSALEGRNLESGPPGAARKAQLGFP
jgi:hypothetical protein